MLNVIEKLLLVCLVPDVSLEVSKQISKQKIDFGVSYLITTQRNGLENRVFLFSNPE